MDQRKNQRAARFLKVSPDWLSSGEGQMEPNISKGHGGMSRLYGFDPTQVPLLSLDQIERHLRTIRLGMTDETPKELINTTAQVKETTFAIKIEDESMSPIFPKGSVIVVQPGMEFQYNDYVVVKEGEHCFFSQYIRYGSESYLKPANERYPLKKFEGCEIIGVAVELIRKLK